LSQNKGLIKIYTIAIKTSGGNEIQYGILKEA
jgi:hypothetical protein